MIIRFMLLFAVIIFNVQARNLDINAKLPGGDYVLQNIDGKNTSLDKIKKLMVFLLFLVVTPVPGSFVGRIGII